jgi:hypothetical protein
MIVNGAGPSPAPKAPGAVLEPIEVQDKVTQFRPPSQLRSSPGTTCPSRDVGLGAALSHGHWEEPALPHCQRGDVGLSWKDEPVEDPGRCREGIRRGLGLERVTRGAETMRTLVRERPNGIGANPGSARPELPKEGSGSDSVDRQAQRVWVGSSGDGCGPGAKQLGSAHPGHHSSRRGSWLPPVPRRHRCGGRSNRERGTWLGRPPACFHR